MTARPTGTPFKKRAVRAFTSENFCKSLDLSGRARFYAIS